MDSTKINSDAEQVQLVMVALITLLLFLGIIGTYYFYFQVIQLKNLHKMHSMARASSLMQSPDQRIQIRQLRDLAKESRRDIHRDLAAELKDLRNFQMEVSSQLSVMKQAVVDLSRK